MKPAQTLGAGNHKIQMATGAKLIKQFIKYFGAALVGYGFDFGLLILLHELLDVHYLIAASCGFVAGLIVLYVISGRYVFGESKIKSRKLEFILFALIGLVGLGILNILMFCFTGLLGFSYLLSKILATVFVYIWNFFARRSLYHS